MPFLSQSLYFLRKIHHIWTSWTPFCHFPVIKGWSPRIVIPICQHIEKISKDSFHETLQKLFGKRRKQMLSVPSLCSLSPSLLTPINCQILSLSRLQSKKKPAHKEDVSSKNPNLLHYSRYLVLRCGHESDLGSPSLAASPNC